MTQGVPNSYAYATIEISDDVEVVKGGHESYPFHIRQVNGKRPILNILSESKHIKDIANPKEGSTNLGSNQVGMAEASIKSAEDIESLKQEANAQYRIESGKNIIEAIKDFNKSDNKAEAVVALTHEIMHPTVVAIIDGAKDGNKVGAKHTQTIVDEFNKANPKSKITVDELIAANEAFKTGTTSKQYRAVQEFIAESWEKYHTQGAKGFSKAFQDVLDQITKAFQSVYKSIKGKQLTPELTQLFDELLGKQPQAAAEANIFDDLDASRVSGAKAKQVASNKAFAEKYGEDAAVAKAISTNFEAIAKELEEKGIFTEINCK